MLLLLAALLQAPAAPAATAQGYAPPPGWVERGRRELEKESSLLPPPRKDVPIFRVRVEEQAIRVERMWEETVMRSGFVRPGQPPDHYEFLKTVTPEEFRGGVLHPIGIDLIGAARFIGKHVGAANRNRRQARAKREVEEALRQFLLETGQSK